MIDGRVGRLYLVGQDQVVRGAAEQIAQPQHLGQALMVKGIRVAAPRDDHVQHTSPFEMGYHEQRLHIGQMLGCGIVRIDNRAADDPWFARVQQLL